MYRFACGIKTQDKFVITGGHDDFSPVRALKTVTRYSRTGQTETLPQLNVARESHACGSYLTDEGDIVRFILNISKYWVIVMQVLLVTGGGQWPGGRYITLDSTEVLENMEAGTWRLTSPLPSARAGLRAASVANNIFVFGDNIF